MAYEVTATRKRPRTFDSLVGQDFVVSTIKSSVESGRIAHAYLFAGPRGVGKTSAARILARMLNAVGQADTQLLEDISRGRALDVIEIDGASNTSVNDIRAIKDEVLFPPQASKYKIYIIDEVHMLSNSAFNALLKTIEEPPPYIIFIFATTEIHKVPATIRSRCQLFNFRLIPLDLVQVKLSEACLEMGVKADPEALAWIAKEGTGSLRDSYTLFDQVLAFSDNHVTLEKIRSKLGFVGLEQLGEFAAMAYAGKAKDALEVLHGILQGGISIEQCIIDLADYYRGVLLVKTGIHRESLLGSTPERYYQGAVEGYTFGQLEQIVRLLLELYRDIRYSLSPKTELELSCVRITRMRWYIDGAALVERLEKMETHYLRSVHTDLSESPTVKENIGEIVAPPVPQPVIPPPENPKMTETSPVRSEPTPDPGMPEGLERFKQLLIKEHPLLAGLLDSLKACQVEGTVLFLHFEQAFAGKKAREEAATLLESAKKVWPGVERIETTKHAGSQTTPTASGLDPSVQLVKEIFRADIVEEHHEPL